MSKSIQIDKKHLSFYEERTKELNCINQTIYITENAGTADELLQEICMVLPKGWQYPEYTHARINYNGKSFTSSNFRESEWCLKQVFVTTDQMEGSIEIFYSKKFPEADEGPFLKQERDLINNLAFIISGAITRKNTQQLLYKHTERLKELRGINETAEILRQSKTLEEALSRICYILPQAWQYPDFTVARITYGDKIFQSKNFTETSWCQRQTFEISPVKQGMIEIYYLKKFPEIDEGPFMKEERHLINNIAGMISGSATKYDFRELLTENTERLKELGGINLTSSIITSGAPMEETLQQICNELPKAWQYPEWTQVRIRYAGETFTSAGFQETIWVQQKSFVTIDNQKGSIEVFYTKEFPEMDEGPFLKEERNLINNIAMIISGYINSIKGRNILNHLPYRSIEEQNKKTYSEVLEKRKATLPPLQDFFDKQAIDKYIYLDMMRFKIKEILFVATVYDAFILENEDNFFEHFMGEIYQYSLYSLPRITAVSSEKEAMDMLRHTSFDLIILMLGNDKEATIELSQTIKNTYPSTPIHLIINKKGDIDYFSNYHSKLDSIDNIFIWNGDSKIFFALVKHIEDNVNVENDTEVGLVRVILLVEDAPAFYSRYLTYLYSIVFNQVQHNIAHVKNELDKISRIRSRPKILLAKNYEEAIFLFNKYMNYILCVISDVEFEREGQYDKTAGIEFIKYIHSQFNTLPVVMASDESKASKAEELGVYFINKYSDHLNQELAHFITNQLGFGDFVFRNMNGEPISTATNLSEFMDQLQTVPEESILYHAKNNQFSIWLMARGEIKLAKMLYPINIQSFETVQELKDYIVEVLGRSLEERNKGKIVAFNEDALLNKKNIVSLSSGSLGGKGRGLAFINMLLSHLDFSDFTKEINICTPATMIIGTEEFDRFIQTNQLYSKILSTYEDDQLKKIFSGAKLSEQLRERLYLTLQYLTMPLAIRSSSLFEDSINQPFSGIFDTYILPNSHKDLRVRFEQLTLAIKMVYFSLYSKAARSYYKTINHKMEEDKMAIIIQEVVGHQYGDYFYPHISGLAQSINYYPVEYMKPEEGYALAAVGLGDYVVKGDKSYRFSPVYPDVSNVSTEELIHFSQTELIAIDLSKERPDLMNQGEYAGLTRIPVHEAEKHGTLNHLVSTYDVDNDRFFPGIHMKGPRVVDFSDILKYNYIPLAQTIRSILTTIEKALGAPAEIEYAVDLNKDQNNKASFYLLQIKPLVGQQARADMHIDHYTRADLLAYSENCLGHGKKQHIQHLVYVDTETFDKHKTVEISREIADINNELEQEGHKYILIGPGRWGTRDRFLGIPVNWADISNAEVITEISLEDYPLEASLGSHFFHNLTTLNVGYIAIQNHSRVEFIDWPTIKAHSPIKEGVFVKCIRFEQPLEVVIDGKNRKAIIK